MDERRKIAVPKELFLAFLNIGQLTYEELKAKYINESFSCKAHGSAVVFCEGTDVYATVWIGVNSVALMVNKEEIKSFKFLIQ
jgi:hypothetical protein